MSLSVFSIITLEIIALLLKALYWHITRFNQSNQSYLIIYINNAATCNYIHTCTNHVL